MTGPDTHLTLCGKCVWVGGFPAIALCQKHAATDDLLAACKSAYEWAHGHGDDCAGRTEHEEGVIFDSTVGCTCYLSKLRNAYLKATGQADAPYGTARPGGQP